MATFTQVLSYILIGILLVTSIYCFIRAPKVKQKAVQWIGIFLFCFTVSTTFNTLESFLIRNIFRNIAIICFMIFTDQAFYIDKKSPIKPLLIVAGVIFVVEIIGGIIWMVNGTASIYLYQKPNAISTIIMGSWLSKTSFDGMKNTKDLDIQPHIKLRYRYLLACGILFTIIGISSLLFSGGDLDNIGKLITSICGIPITIIFALTWIMPQAMKDWINREFNAAKANERKMSEEDIMKELGGV